MIGIDIEEVERFKSFTKTKLARIFTAQEIEYCFKFNEPYTHIAGIWCVKEAFIKAVKRKDVPVKNIEVKHYENGAPYIEITPKLEPYFLEHNASYIDISISHTDKTAVGIVQIL